MGLPSIDITFKTLGMTAIQRSQKGIVAVILEDAAGAGAHIMTNVTDIPSALGAENRAYLERAFTGYVNPPRKVIAYVVDGTEKTLDDALAYFATQQFDYLVGAPDTESADAQKIASWVKSERANKHTVKAVLPGTAADSEAVVNFTTGGIRLGEASVTTAAFCSRIAGLIAGTPMTISCTYAPLAEVSDVTRLTKEQLDTAIDSGEFVLFHDGEKVKVGRGVNSLKTTSQEKGEAFKKIKIVEAMDMIQNDIRMTAEDGYIGKYANSYDNKCLLIMAVKGYLEELERSGILETGTSVVELDLAAQENYLKSKGIDTSDMSEQQIKEANTDAKVFLRARVSILDAIEDIVLPITI
ncbi:MULTISPECIES: phage tail sheath subtilisin-like domain-containing protein [Anaerotruncus]|uniref:phage tail sheath subtilisin-like domain-containing protein n=1 Tax=Anaerotruncus TaxID=244127 RepID=UPI00208C6BBF|nr:phage tail sheath subtilisin-like domain-containing protein [Anaerotruncus massiliensis (ex Togo et al. 2019)]GKH45746.1 phage portal protein [Oscillospiraceae bacterium]